MTKKTFYCLRCGHRFAVDYEPKTTVERSCPNCASNSVRLESRAAAAQRDQEHTVQGEGG